MMNNHKIANLIKGTAFALVALFLGANTVLAADCESNYGGCSVEKKFTIRKYVKLEGDTVWKDEVVINLNDAKEAGRKILFKVEVSNRITGSNVDISSLDLDDMKMQDQWPDVIKFLDAESQNKLIEEWDNFKSNDTKVFYFTGTLSDAEKNRTGNFQKCVVNKAELYYLGDEVGQDDAVVCYKKATVGEILGASTVLPATGPEPIVGVIGIAFTMLGTYLKKKNK